ncbi:transcriptional regulator [Actinosynnema sp. ALI-1.44]|uniref:ATP-binding protein n=1 Tax=Actinosynnema sp. ALI-1.44 TaxID=1933779 RepID=UPI00097C8551|nr:ATP-binding protein [Actinosynnema sp. ALI-1.44]ONI81422.1 transcriptional regulator [Actinosynnema sp. ALI-1.44]
MDAVSQAALCRAATQDVAWIRVEETSSVGAARRVAGVLADKLGCSPTRVAEIEVAVTELGTNLVKHATEGVMVVRSVRTVDEAVVEVVAVDRGPGIGDMDKVFRDGHSTSGTLGIGLGAVLRLADSHEVYSELSAGTVLAVRFHPRRTRIDTTGDVSAGVTRPINGEEICGDSYAVRRVDGRTLLMLCDGAGHGPLAASASQLAVRVFCESESSDSEVLVGQIHRALAGTRGGAVAVAQLDEGAGQVRFTGIGNISGAVVAAGQKRGMVCLPGIAGHQARKIRSFDYPVPADAAVVMHSDGLTERWTAQGRERLFAGRPLPIAMTLLRDAGTRRDDASVLVAKLPGG